MSTVRSLVARPVLPYVVALILSLASVALIPVADAAGWPLWSYLIAIPVLVGNWIVVVARTSG